LVLKHHYFDERNSIPGPFQELLLRLHCRHSSTEGEQEKEQRGFHSALSCWILLSSLDV
jgi:hypothetical protein